eukprot:m.10584 g.10584  ORF g.10584 m.10584 type:complete len:50 (-) comp5587_c0_seq1:2128-2277(-)
MTRMTHVQAEITTSTDTFWEQNYMLSVYAPLFSSNDCSTSTNGGRPSTS